MSTIDPNTGLEGFNGWEATARGIVCSHDPSHGARGARIYRLGEHVTCEWCLADWADFLIELQELGDRLGVPRSAARCGGESIGRLPTGAEVRADLRKWTSGSTEERRRAGHMIILAMERWRRAEAPGEKHATGDGIQ